METCHQPSDRAQGCVGLRPRRVRRYRHVTLDEHEALSPVVADADRHRRRLEPSVAQAAQERVDRSNMGTRRPQHVLTDANDLADVRDSTDQRLLLLHPASVAAQPADDQIACPSPQKAACQAPVTWHPWLTPVLVERRSTPAPWKVLDNPNPLRTIAHSRTGAL